MQAIYEILLKKVLGIFASITSDQWEKSKALVTKAALEMATLPGAERRDFVVAELKKYWPKLALYAVNLLVDGAFSVLKNRLPK